MTSLSGSSGLCPVQWLVCGNGTKIVCGTVQLTLVPDSGFMKLNWFLGNKQSLGSGFRVQMCLTKADRPFCHTSIKRGQKFGLVSHVVNELCLGSKGFANNKRVAAVQTLLL